MLLDHLRPSVMMVSASVLNRHAAHLLLLGNMSFEGGLHLAW